MKGEFALVIVFAPTGADGNQPRASSHRERRLGLKVTQLAFALKGQRTIDTFPVPLSGHQLLAPTHPGRRLLRALALGWFPLPPSGNAVKDFFSTIYKRMRKWEGEAPAEPLSLLTSLGPSGSAGASPSHQIKILHGVTLRGITWNAAVKFLGSRGRRATQETERLGRSLALPSCDPVITL